MRPRDFVGKRATGGINLLVNRGGEFPTSVARVLVRDIRAQEPDHVILSGDLTNLAFPAEFELVRGLLEQLHLPPSDVTVVPGNHDYYTRGSAQQDHFGRIMAPYLGGDEQPGPGPYPLLRLRGELAVVALNSAHPTPPLMAYGTVGARQMEQARQLLAGERCRGRFRLVVLHHPPHRAHVRWTARLVDRRAFVAMLGRVGADLVVHGHLHRPLLRQLDGPVGPIPVIGVGSGTWLSPSDPTRRAQYNLYRIEEARLVDVRARRLDQAGLGFEIA